MLVGLRSNLKCQLHAMLAGAGVAVPMSDLFSAGGHQLLTSTALAVESRARVDSLLRLITALDEPPSTAVVAGQRSARRLDLVPGRSAAALSGWLAAREQTFRDRVEIVAMDGLGGYKTRHRGATRRGTAMDPYRVVALVGHKLDLCRQRVLQRTTGHQGRSGDPPCWVRRTLRTRLALPTDRQRERLEAVFAHEDHVAVSVTWWSTSRSSPPTPIPTRRRRTRLSRLIDTLRRGIPSGSRNWPPAAPR